MKSLLERSSGNIAFAKRWIEYVRERKTLRARIAALESDAAHNRNHVRALDEKLADKDRIISDLKRASQELPQDVQWLLEEANRLITGISMGGAVRYAVDFRAWLGEYNARKAAPGGDRYERKTR